MFWRERTTEQLKSVLKKYSRLISSRFNTVNLNLKFNNPVFSDKMGNIVQEVRKPRRVKSVCVKKKIVQVQLSLEEFTCSLFDSKSSRFEVERNVCTVVDNKIIKRPCKLSVL